MAVRRHIDAAPGGPHSIAALSRVGGLNRRKLTEGFKALFGTSVANYVLSQRMSLARPMLESGISVAEVSERVGYRDRTSFSRAFRRVTGQSPMTVRMK